MLRYSICPAGLGGMDDGHAFAGGKRRILGPFLRVRSLAGRSGGPSMQSLLMLNSPQHGRRLPVMAAHAMQATHGGADTDATLSYLYRLARQQVVEPLAWMQSGGGPPPDCIDLQHARF